MSQENAGTTLFSSHVDAEQAVKALQRSGFNLKKLSIVGKDYHTEEHVVGAFWGAMWGLLFGSAFLLIPGMGPVVVAGPLVASIVSGLEGAVLLGGLSALGAALYSIGIPKDSVLRYETAIKSDQYLLVVHGSVDEVALAKEALTSMGHEVQVHCACIPA
jgi:hypothetical protein